MAFRGVGLRPYAVCHLRARQVGGDTALTWVRRTRIGGDGWDGYDVPLGEAAERYVVSLTRGAAVIHSRVVAEAAYEIPAGVWEDAAGGGGFAIEVAQLSDVYGPGPSVRRNIEAVEEVGCKVRGQFPPAL